MVHSQRIPGTPSNRQWTKRHRTRHPEPTKPKPDHELSSLIVKVKIRYAFGGSIVACFLFHTSGRFCQIFNEGATYIHHEFQSPLPRYKSVPRCQVLGHLKVRLPPHNDGDLSSEQIYLLCQARRSMQCKKKRGIHMRAQLTVQGPQLRAKSLFQVKVST
ncbi:hypothetical protein EDD85DRAFT_511964 [Armillaria nabsnona]|nr:hypothetical protein EDD85DRAFT_511964 [Armillaria nabsnona]